MNQISRWSSIRNVMTFADFLADETGGFIA
jgi:hypothetical protein